MSKKVGFDAQGAQRVARATKIVERAYRLPPIDPLGAIEGGPWGGLCPARTTTSITAKASLATGKGKIKVYTMDETGALTLGEQEIDCWNLGGSVPTDTDILVSFGLRGPWVVVVPC